MEGIKESKDKLLTTELDSRFTKEMVKVMTINNQLIYLWEELVKLRNKSYEESIVEIDFNDMIYLPVIKNFHIPIDPVYLMIDEAQDLNLAQHKLIENLINDIASR